MTAQQDSRPTPVEFNESGISVEFKTEIDPPQPGKQFEARGVTSVKGKRNITHRIFVDQTSGATFGYDLEIEPSSLANHFMLSVKPLSAEKLTIKSLPVKAVPVARSPIEAKQRISQKGTTIESNRNPAKLSGSGSTIVTNENNIGESIPLTFSKSLKYPPAFLIEDGGMFALDVLFNPQTGVKIVDFIKISSEAKRAGVIDLKLLPVRDFSLDAIQLTMKNFKLQINEQTVLGAKTPVLDGISGAIIWIYLPGRGRFIFSLIPHEEYGFQKTGMVRDNKISFQFLGDRYEWISSTTVFNGGWNLWVLHEPNYLPQDKLSSDGSYQIGSSDRIEYLLKKK